MKTKSLCKALGSGATILSILALMAGRAVAQQQPGYAYPPPPGYNSQPQAPAYPQPQQPYASPQYSQPGYSYPEAPSYAPPPDTHSGYMTPHEFFPIFGRRVGQMFRRLFYGDDSSSDYQGGSSYQGSQPDYSLDTPPPYGSHYGVSPGINNPQQPAYPPRYQTAPNLEPRYDTPPPVSGPRVNTTPVQPPKTPPAVEKKKTPSTPSKKYTPPSITRTTPSEQPKEESQPPPPAKEKAATSTPPQTDYNFYPLPGSKPAPEKSSPPPTPPTVKNNNEPGASKSVGSANSGNFLKGKRTNKEGRVISPYPPYQELDVTGLSSGSLALDPTTQKVFEVP